jgi:hypothetical protein
MGNNTEMGWLGFSIDHCKDTTNKQQHTPATTREPTMNKSLTKPLTALKQNKWLLAAFLVPLAIRSIPEMLSWPYLLGLDTLTVVNYIQSGFVLSTPMHFFQNQLFYSIATATNWFVGDPIVVLKIFGPLLMGLVSVMMYLYARRG